MFAPGWPSQLGYELCRPEKENVGFRNKDDLGMRKKLTRVV